MTHQTKDTSLVYKARIFAIATCISSMPAPSDLGTSSEISSLIHTTSASMTDSGERVLYTPVSVSPARVINDSYSAYRRLINWILNTHEKRPY